MLTFDCFLKQRDRLKEERGVLVRNISCLFKTAKLELDRKSAEISELRKTLRKLEQEVNRNGGDARSQRG